MQRLLATFPFLALLPPCCLGFHSLAKTHPAPILFPTAFPSIVKQDAPPRRKTTLFESPNDIENDSSDDHSDSSIRFLGRGPHAIVRPGVVLLAPPDEFHHFLREAAVFVYAMGQDEDYDRYVIRGVILDHPTAFSMHEMMEKQGNDEDDSDEKDHRQVLQNLMYRGGELGDAAFMLHSDEHLGAATESEMIGMSGVYQGGLEYALENGYSLSPDKAKFFFNYMEFTEQELEGMLENRDEESTAWVSVEVPPDLVLRSDYGRGEAWARLRNAVRER